MKKGAIFDMDGTLIDTERLYQQGWFSVAEEFGEKSSMDLAKSVSGTSNDQMREVVHSFYPNVDADLYVERVIAFVKKRTDEHIDLMPGVREILQFFKDNGIKMSVASSSPKEIIKINLTRVGIADYFDEFVSGEEVENGKPEPDIFLRAAKLIAISPEECYAFEDSLNGIRAAAAAGCAAIMIPDQVEPTEDIKKLTVAICPSLNDALAAIKTGRL